VKAVDLASLRFQQRYCSSNCRELMAMRAVGRDG